MEQRPLTGLVRRGNDTSKAQRIDILTPPTLSILDHNSTKRQVEPSARLPSQRHLRQTLRTETHDPDQRPGIEPESLQRRSLLLLLPFVSFLEKVKTIKTKCRNEFEFYSKIK
jgi:hypothetical protein